MSALLGKKLNHRILYSSCPHITHSKLTSSFYSVPSILSIVRHQADDAVHPYERDGVVSCPFRPRESSRNYLIRKDRHRHFRVVDDAVLNMWALSDRSDGRWPQLARTHTLY